MVFVSSVPIAGLQTEQSRLASVPHGQPMHRLVALIRKLGRVTVDASRSSLALGVLAAGFLASNTGAIGGTMSFVGSGLNDLGDTISASASFDTSVAGELSITLANTNSTVIHAGGADVLTGLFFEANGSLSLTPVSDGLGAGSVMLPASASPPGLLTGWGFFANPSGVRGIPSGEWAVSATGLVAGQNLDFTDTYHNSSGYLGSPNYGILGNPADTFGGFSPLVADSITFDFLYTGSIGSISKVEFLYGSSNGEGLIGGHPPSVPDGGETGAFLAAALLGLVVLRSRVERA